MAPINRRRFLQAAGGAAALSALAPSIARAASIPANHRTGTLRDVEHIVVLMQENRSFDHYFGTMRGVRGFGDPRPVTMPSGKPVWYQSDGAREVLPFRPDANDLGLAFLEDLPHGWNDGHDAFAGGRYDRWVPAKSATTMAYLTREDMPFHFALADAFGDNSLLYFHQYQNAVPGEPLYDNARTGTDAKRGEGFFDALRADVLAGRLPQVSWVVAPEAYTEHPNWPVNYGAWYVAQMLDALTADPEVWSRTALFITYDENDGFFDHIVPPFPPGPGQGSSTVDTRLELYNGPLGVAGPYGLGQRVPMIVVSPWSKGGWVCSQTFDHTSVIRFIEKRFGVLEPNITPWRRAICGDLTSAFDFARPDASVPALPPTDAYEPPPRLLAATAGRSRPAPAGARRTALARAALQPRRGLPCGRIGPAALRQPRLGRRVIPGHVRRRRPPDLHGRARTLAVRPPGRPPLQPERPRPQRLPAPVRRRRGHARDRGHGEPQRLERLRPPRSGQPRPLDGERRNPRRLHRHNHHHPRTPIGAVGASHTSAAAYRNLVRPLRESGRR
jgi:phospholipase C